VDPGIREFFSNVTVKLMEITFIEQGETSFFT
jgi:hypothetical protein